MAPGSGLGSTGGWAYDVEETASTPKGTWLRLEGDVLLFWDGTRLSAYFHPGTREQGIRYAE
jgi:hypothetical protein